MALTMREELRAAYKASGLTQAHIAARAGVHENAVYRVVSTNRNVTIDVLVAVAQVLGVRSLTIPDNHTGM